MLSLSHCTCFHLRRAARRVSQLYDHALAPVGLSLNEYSILRRLEVAQSLGTLASTLGMDRTTSPATSNRCWQPAGLRPSAARMPGKNGCA